MERQTQQAESQNAYTLATITLVWGQIIWLIDIIYLVELSHSCADPCGSENMISRYDALQEDQWTMYKWII